MQDYKRLFLWICWFLGTYAAFSQEIVIVDTTNQQYKKEFINLYNQRVAQQQLVFEKITDKKIRKEVESTYKEVSTDFIENINKGFFIENESYRELLDEILDKIKTNNPDFPEISNTKILISFGVLPNAYAIGNDIVVVLVPLIKSIKNEYELAFIISHEIAHNLLQHSFNGVIEYATLKHSSELKKKTREIDKQKYNKSQIASGLYRDIVYGKRKNSRKLEHQADSLGFVLFKNAFKGYEYQAVMSLETLGEIDKELDSLSAPDYFKFFNTEKHPFKNEWINNDELSAYKYDKSPKFWQVDSLKTHPDCGLRAGFVKKNFMVQPTDLSSASEKFTRLQKSSSFNHVLGLYVIEEYGKSLYETFLLLKEYPENEFLVGMAYQNLIKLQEAQQAYTLNKYLDTVNPKYSDSYNRFLYFFRQLRKSQLNAIIEKYKTNT